MFSPVFLQLIEYLPKTTQFLTQKDKDTTGLLPKYFILFNPFTPCFRSKIDVSLKLGCCSIFNWTRITLIIRLPEKFTISHRKD